MSIHEARRAWPQRMLDSFVGEEVVPPTPPTPLEQTERLVAMAKTAGTIDRQSPTWAAVCRWAATAIIELRAQSGSEGRDAQIKVLLALLEIDERNTPVTIDDSGSDMP